MRKREIVWVVLLVLFVVPFVGAEIIISQPEASYNIGDGFNFTITLSPKIDSSGFFAANLVCGASEFGIFKSPATISGGEQRSFVLDGRFDSFLVGDLRGKCIIRALYGGESGTSQTFDLTKGVRVTVEIDGFVFDPGKSIHVSGRAYKNTGGALNGFVEVSLNSINSSNSGKVTDGEFDLVYDIPSNAPGGDYSLVIRAYDVDGSGEVMNEGSLIESIKIKQVISDIGVAINKQSVTPGEEVVYTVVLYDQAGFEVEEDLDLSIYSPDDELYERDLLKSGESQRFETETNFSFGYWKIEAIVRELKGERSFYVEELEKIDFELEDNTLVIENIGNILYEKKLKVTIGGIENIISVGLEPGESGRYKLFAPDGEYEIGIGGGNESQSLGTAYLTGNAIGIEAIKGIKISGFNVLIWLIVLIILGIIALILYRKIRKKPFIGKTPKKATSTIAGKRGVNVKANSGGIESGQRLESYVVALKIKGVSMRNSTSGGKTAGTVGEPGTAGAIDFALMKAKLSKAKIYISEQFRLLIFTKILTGENDNGVRALSVANGIKDDLTGKDIDFGIGCHVGDLIVEKREGKLKFTSLGNTITRAKSLSGISDGDVLLSNELHGKVVGKVKSDKRPNENYWRLRKLMDRSKYQGFVNKFIKKQSEDKG